MRTIKKLKSSRGRTGKDADALALLEEQHRNFEKLFLKVETAEGDEKRSTTTSIPPAAKRSITSRACGPRRAFGFTSIRPRRRAIPPVRG